MTPEDLRKIIAFLEERVQLAGSSPPLISFAEPTSEEMIGAGLDRDGVGRLLASAWWPEMVDEVVETPEFCEPGDSPEQVLRYARDVIVEYIGKRFVPE
jgi:hypothetical protein